jgi:hypothetical protein
MGEAEAAVTGRKVGIDGPFLSISNIKEMN